MRPRLDDWEARLDAVVRAWLPRRYDLITASCCHFAADVIEALTGDDAWQALGVTRPQTMVDVARARQLFGGTAGFAKAYFGEPQARLTLHTGDLVLTTGDHDDTLALVMGAHALCTTDMGLQRISLDDCFDGWRVGA